MSDVYDTSGVEWCQLHALCKYFHGKLSVVDTFVYNKQITSTFGSPGEQYHSEKYFIHLECCNKIFVQFFIALLVLGTI